MNLIIKLNNKSIIVFFALYVLINTLYSITESILIKNIIFFLIVLFLIISTIKIIKNYKKLPQLFILLSILIFLLSFFPLLYNFSLNSLSLFLKLNGMFIMLLLGMLNNNSNNLFIDIRKMKLYIYFIVFTPILIFFYQFFFLEGFSYIDKVSIFSNKNNAVFFSITTSLFIFYLYSIRITLLFLLFVILFYNTLGAVLSFIIAFIYIFFTRKHIVYLLVYTLIFLFIIQLGILLELEIFNRLKDFRTILEVMLKYDLFKDIQNVSYGEIVSITNTKDLSFVFRLKHWINILHIYVQGGLENYIFGIGFNNIEHVTKLMLKAHNDYIRILVEGGTLLFIVYIFYLFKLLQYLGKVETSIPFIIFLIYSFSENLLDNFLTIGILFYIVGYIIIHKKKDKHEHIVRK